MRSREFMYNIGLPGFFIICNIEHFGLYTDTDILCTGPQSTFNSCLGTAEYVIRSLSANVVYLVIMGSLNFINTLRKHLVFCYYYFK